MLGASAGLVSAPFFKVTSLLLWQKITLAAVTSGFLIFNLNTWKTALEGIGGRILSSSSANLGPNIPSSPTDFIIPSLLEKTELLSPLDKLIKTQLSLDYLLLLFLIVLTVLIFNKSFLTNSKTTSILNKILNENLSLKLENYKKIDIDIFNNLFFRVLFILIATSLIFNILINILINFELTLNLEYYIQSHENFKNSICFLFPLLVDLNKPELAQKGKNKNKTHKK
jgi:hypothetical protein